MLRLCYVIDDFTDWGMLNEQEVQRLEVMGTDMLWDLKNDAGRRREGDTIPLSMDQLFRDREGNAPSCGCASTLPVLHDDGGAFAARGWAPHQRRVRWHGRDDDVILVALDKVPHPRRGGQHGRDDDGAMLYVIGQHISDLSASAVVIIGMSGSIFVRGCICDYVHVR